MILQQSREKDTEHQTPQQRILTSLPDAARPRQTDRQIHDGCTLLATRDRQTFFLSRMRPWELDFFPAKA